MRWFVAQDETERMARWQGMAERMRDALQDVDGVKGEVTYPTRGGRPLCIPRTRLAIDEAVVGCTIVEMDEVLEGGNPAVAIFADAANGAIWLNPQHLEDGEEMLVAKRVGELLRGGGGV